jgi:hypothetical protein
LNGSNFNLINYIYKLSKKATTYHVTEVSLEILDATGRVVASHNLGNLPNGFQSITLNVSNLSNGLYLCNIKAGETKISKRIIKN